MAPGPAAVKVQVRPRQCRSGCLLCLESYCQESRSWWGGENRGGVGGGSVAGLCRSWALNTGLGHPGLPSVRPTLNQTFRGCPSI